MPSQRVFADLHAYFKAHPRELTDAAEAIGCAKSTLSMIRWGLRQPSLPLALRIAEHCHVPLESLLRPTPSLKRAS